MNELRYNRLIERMRDVSRPIQHNSFIELSQARQELLDQCHIENRGNKIILSDNIGNVIKVIPV